jgi:hypothetical protein
MKRAAASRVTILALAAFASVTTAALAEPPDPCKTGCATHGHMTNYLNPQPLPPGVKGPGHGGSSFVALRYPGYGNGYGRGGGAGKVY